VREFTHEALKHVIDRLDVGIFVLNQQLEIEFWNHFMAANSGRPGSAVIGQNLFEVFAELPERWLRKKIEGVFVLKNRSFTAWEQRPYLFRFNHNRPVTGGVDFMYQNCSFIPVRDEDGEVVSVAVTLQDVTDLAIAHRELEAARLQLEESNRVDGLTKLFNRSHWEGCLLRECKRSQRYAAKTALIMFDLDHFKKINDSYGHLGGDAVLRSVAACLKALVRETDIVGRYGGEEFGVIVADSDVQGAAILAERIRKAVETLVIEFDDRIIPVTISLGVAGFTPEIDRHEILIAQADEALYRSKERGRNCYTLYQPASS
jgi:diguanylate cyclase (GGDEF)-like protein